MAVTTRRGSGGKTNIYWTKDTDNQDGSIVKVHFPGVNLEPTFDIKKPMVKKPVKPRRPDSLMLQKRSKIEAMKKIKALKSDKEIMEDKTRQDLDDIPVKDTANHQVSESPKKVGLKDLKPEDKKRVANLVKELAKVGEEREVALSQLNEERMAFEERLQILQEEYDGNINEKLNLQNRFLELQDLLKKYKEDEKSKHTPRQDVMKNQSSHTTQTSPFLSPFGSQHKIPFQEIPGNERKISPIHKKIDTNESNISRSNSTPGTKRTVSPQESPGNSETRLSRQSTPVPSTSDLVPGNDRVEMSQESKSKSVITSTTRQQPSASSQDARLHEQARRSKHESTPVPGTSALVPGHDRVEMSHESKSKSVITSTTRQQPSASSQDARLHEQARHSKHESTPVPGTSALVPGHDRVEMSHESKSKSVITSTTRQQPSASSQDARLHEQARRSKHESRSSAHVSQQSPVVRKVARARHDATDLPETEQPMSHHNQSLSCHPPTKTTDQEPPVYVNKIFDMSVARPINGRPFLPPVMDTNNRSQSDTSQSFSAELDAVYRLYCREYELQLQLQQQQLELQKQQLQLQQQLQQLELFQQRQQTQQQVTAPVIQQQPSTPAKPIIRETPIPTPAPQPSAQPRQVSPLDGLVPTPNDSQHQQSTSFKTNGRTTLDEGRHGEEQTVRRITSSKRPQKSQRPSYHDGSYTTHHPIPIQEPAGLEDMDDFKHNSLQHQSQRTKGSVSKEIIINPKEAAQFNFSLYKDSILSPKKNTTTTIDWSSASDFDFRRMQESRIREHYSLPQYPLQSTQASLPLHEPVPSRASYNLYERTSIAEEPSKVNGREVNGRNYPRHDTHEMDGRKVDGRSYPRPDTHEMDEREVDGRSYPRHDTHEMDGREVNGRSYPRHDTHEMDGREVNGRSYPRHDTHEMDGREVNGRSYPRHDTHEIDGREVDGRSYPRPDTHEMDGREVNGRSYSRHDRHNGNSSNRQTQPLYQSYQTRYDPQHPSNQHYSLYTSRDQINHRDNHYVDNDEIIAPWVSPSSSLQRDIHQEPSHDLNYPLQIVDLVNELEEEPTISSPSRKPSYTVYPNSLLADPIALGGVLDSTDSGYSNVSKDVYERKSSQHVVDLDSQAENEERDVLEDIFFI